MQRHRLKALIVLAAASAAAVAPQLAGSSAVAANARLAIGPAARLPLFSAVTRALTTQTLHLTVALKSRDPAGLLSYAEQVSTPGSPLYHHYLTVPEFAGRFGATPIAVAAVENALRGDGLSVGTATANDLAFEATGSASAIDNALATTIDQVTLPSGRSVIANLTAPTLPAAVAGYVEGVIGIDDVTPATPAIVVSRGGQPRLAAGPHPSAHVVTGGPQPCAAATQKAAQGGYTADELAGAYQFSSLYQAGDLGAGQTIGLVELTPFGASDVAAYQTCYGTTTTVNTINVGLGFSPFNPATGDDGESALDIEVALSMAPKATIDVYEGNPQSAGISEQAVVMNQIAADNVAKEISSSYGVCEAATPSTAISMENQLLQEMAIQGQSFFSSSGDSGSEMCSQLGKTLQNGSPNPQWNANLSVEDPAAQPFATGVGGTEMVSLCTGSTGATVPCLDTQGTTPSEVVWNEGTSPNCKCGGRELDGFGGGGGGGVSQLFSLPSYQSSYFTTLGLTPSGGNPGCGSSQCREVPDVAADADGSTGYAVYVTLQVHQSSGANTPQTGWQVVGGTSAASPLWAAFMALVNADPACNGKLIGFANPALYKIASGAAAYAADFHDAAPIAQLGSSQPMNNDTLFQFGVGGNDFQSLYPETVGYDMATGLGSMVAPALAASLCAFGVPFTVTVKAPAAQAATVGKPYALQLSGTDSGGSTLTYTATGLPAGLSISPNGLISGTPTTPGTSTVGITATDQLKNTGTASFTITIVAAVPTGPTGPSGATGSTGSVGPGKPAAKVAVSGVAMNRATLSVTAGQGKNAPALRVITIGLPDGLELDRSSSALHKGLKVSTAPGNSFTTRIAGGRLTLTFATPVSTATVRIGRPLVTVSKSLRRGLGHHHKRSLHIAVVLTDAAGTVSTATFTVVV